MHKMVVVYPEPADRDAFRTYYEETHVPLAAKLPGIRSMRYAFDVKGVGGTSPYFAIFEADFDSREDMHKALASPEGAAVGADVPNYATGGAHILSYESIEHE
jgi:uncharacterized protein (TIGR02118 family)